MSNHRESGPNSRRRLLLIELNEVNLDLARAYVENGTLTLPVAGVFDATDAADAVRASNTAGRVGKVLLKF